MQSTFLCVFIKTVRKVSKPKKIEGTLVYEMCSGQNEGAERDLMDKITCTQRAEGWVSPK